MALTAQNVVENYIANTKDALKKVKEVLNEKYLLPNVREIYTATEFRLASELQLLNNVLESINEKVKTY